MRICVYAFKVSATLVEINMLIKAHTIQIYQLKVCSLVCWFEQDISHGVISV